MDALRIRGPIIMGVIGLVFLLFMGRLFSIQVLSEEYALKADRYVIKTKPVVPPRGNIFNRNGEIYVSNRPVFSIWINRSELVIPPADTAIILEHLNMSGEDLRKEIEDAPYRKEYVIGRHIDPPTYSKLQEKLLACQGITFTASNERNYQQATGANILGYINEVSPKEIEEANGRYLRGDLIGKSGIERSHDSTLRGEQGVKKVLTNVHNREVGRFADGKKDVPAKKGLDIMLGLDTELQAFGESIMANKKGSIVAIEPATGEILAFVSAPSYSPEMLSGKELQQNWKNLRNDTLKPLYNRPLMARYPPGSIFKLPVALAALNEGIIDPNTYYSCGGGFKRNKGKPGCRFHVTPLKLDNAIKYSCNSYFAATYMDFLHHEQYDSFYEGYQTWYRYMNMMGIGRELGVDIPYEVSGLLPTSKRYDRWYGPDRWVATTIISNSIGQGEILMTPLQMANMVALIANQGYYVRPHFVRAVREPNEEDWVRLVHNSSNTSIATQHFRTVIDAMEQVVATGTARRAFISDIPVCGKTGTVQNPHGEDHAVFVGFAPKENPEIAIAVVIENAGGGGSWAAPTASLMIEYFKRREIKEKQWEFQRISNATFLPQ
ncbi:MAG: penicillin-binding protein 2 [Bacteroidota bacterium]